MGVSRPKHALALGIIPLLLIVPLVSGCLSSTKAKAPAVRKLPILTNSVGIKMVLLPTGTFLMGDKNIPDARPLHRVKLSSFWIGQFEVTNQQYEMFKRQTRPPESLGNTQPAVNVTWINASNFCKWLSKREKRSYRLPTEAEWEYAARGGLVQKTYPWGDEDAGGRATIQQMTTTPVGSHAPNGFGLYDMAGNVQEWVSDWYGEDYYARSPLLNPRGPAQSYFLAQPGPKGQWKIARGGFYMIRTFA